MSGKFTRLKYDEPYFRTRVAQSVAPMCNRLYVGQKRNCNKCLPLIGSYYKGDRFDSKNPDQVGIETVLKRQSRPYGQARDGIHYINVRRYNYDVPTVCPKFKDSMPTSLTHPKEHYREMEVDRFYDLHRDQSSWVYWDTSMNTKLAAKDNYRPKYPLPLDVNSSLPIGQRTYKNSH